MNALKIIPALCLATLLLNGCTPLLVGGTVATGANIAHDRRTVGTYIDDAGIELKALGAIRRDKNLSKQIHVSVISINGVVLLVGQAPADSLRERVGEIVQGIQKVRHVHNEMTVAAPSSLMARSSDTVITTKVKTSLIGIKGFDDLDPTRVKVVTENGTVFLMGLLYRAEAQAVAERTSRVRGVQKVVKLFEYLD